MGKYIAFDIGDKRIGIAVSDPFNQMALPLETYWRKNFEKDLNYLIEIAKSKNAEVIVCGLPVNFDGSPSEQTVKTQSFIDALKERTDILIDTVDERFTTMEAHRVLIEANLRREDRKKAVDMVAASYILENYLKRIENGEKK